MAATIRKYCWKTLSILLTLTMTLSITACGGGVSDDDQVRAKLSSLLDAFASPTEENLKTYVESMTDEQRAQIDEYGMDLDEMMAHLFEHFSYSVNEINVEGDSATANVTISNASIAQAIKAAQASIAEDADTLAQFQDSYAAGDAKGFTDLASQKLYEALDASSETVDTDVSIRFTKTGGEWNIDKDCMKSMYSAAYGGMDVGEQNVMSAPMDDMSIRATLVAMIGVLKNPTEENLAPYMDAIDQSTLDGIDERGIDLYEMLGHLLGRLEYTIDDVTVEGDSGVADLTVTNANIAAAFEVVRKDAEEDEEYLSELAEVYEREGELGLYKLIVERLYSTIDGSEDMVTTSVKLKLKRANGMWDFDQDSLSDFVLALYGGVDTSDL